MTRIIERYEAHYEMHEVPFGRIYHWYPTYIVIECDCGEKLRFDTISTITACQCGAEHSDVIRDIQEQEGRLRDQVTHPWLYDAQEQEEQHLRDEAAYPKGSPLCYNDVTAGLGMLKRDGRRPEHSSSGPLFIPLAPLRFREN